MLIKIKKASDPQSSEITPPEAYISRRDFLRLGAGSLLAAGSMGGAVWQAQAADKLSGVAKGPYGTSEELTPYESVTTYNNYYEFGTDKEDPARLARTFVSRPWTVTVEGHAEKTGVFELDELIRLHPLQERIYRLRCVEGWSMVIPWVGIPLSDMLKRFKPTSRAKYVSFTTLNDPARLPGQRRRVLEWPYIEGLRVDEAMHPLTLLAVGLYGEVLPNQNGAPLRLVVPWKYGFKSIKAIVRISFEEQQPVNTWARTAPSEYGFYANVNPQVDHPRWSQAKERRIGDYFKRETKMFNGYADQVASLYAGMDLHRHF